MTDEERLLGLDPDKYHKGPWSPQNYIGVTVPGSDKKDEMAAVIEAMKNKSIQDNTLAKAQETVIGHGDSISTIRQKRMLPNKAMGLPIDEGLPSEEDDRRAMELGFELHPIGD